MAVSPGLLEVPQVHAAGHGQARVPGGRLGGVAEERYDHADDEAVDRVQEHADERGQDEQSAAPLVVPEELDDVVNGRHANGGVHKQRCDGRLRQVGEPWHGNNRDDEDRDGVHRLRGPVRCPELHVHRGSHEDACRGKRAHHPADRVSKHEAQGLAAVVKRPVHLLLRDLCGDERLQDSNEGDPEGSGDDAASLALSVVRERLLRKLDDPGLQDSVLVLQRGEREAAQVVGVG
mmetsp:Transcript_66617/g.189102  ORF Transcript_66617/g.189102 Transcript_66617/m.189102 type:complete len:234 (+) Transcript_66617:588-1289(+)